MGGQGVLCVCSFCGFVMWIHKLSQFPPTPLLHLLAVYLSYWVSVLSLLCIRCDSRIYQGSLDSSVGKESTCNAGDPGSIPGLGRSVGEGIGYPVQYSWASLVAQLVKNPPAMPETWVHPWVWKIPWRREWLPTPVLWPGESHGFYSLWGL